MNLKIKTISIVGVVSLFLFLILFVSFRLTILEAFSDLEKNKVKQDSIRVTAAIERELEGIESITIDWAEWDDTYTFIADLNEDYIDANLNESIFYNQRLDVIIYVNAEGEVVHSKSYIYEDKKETPINQELIKYIEANKEDLFNIEKDKSLKGIIDLPSDNKMALAIRPINTSKGDNIPNGYLIMGRYLDKNEIEHLQKITQLNINFLDIRSVDDKFLAPILENDEPIIKVKDNNNNVIEGFVILKDVHNKPIILVKVSLPRDIFAVGIESLDFFLYSLMVVMLVFSFLMVFLLHQMILKRIQDLTSILHRVINNGDLRQRATICGRDEVTYLAVTINKLFDSLRTTQYDLQYASYHDSLTGLLNRNSFENELKQITIENNTVISIVVCDVDGLKIVNDEYGHTEGDNLLKLSANIIKQCFRDEDKIYRIGGDEFVVILPTNSEDIVEDICRRVKITIDKYNANNPQIPISISIGYAINSLKDIDMAALFKEADDKMYDQKYKHHNSTRKLMCSIKNGKK